MAQVFISFEKSDADIVIPLATALERSGIRTWYYLRDSVPGPSYLRQIATAIKECQVIVAVASPAALKSDQVNNEMVQALEEGKPVMPLRRGVTHKKIQANPDWRGALRAATSVEVPADGVVGLLPKVIEGLVQMGVATGPPVLPADPPAPTAPVLRVRGTLRKWLESKSRGIVAEKRLLLRLLPAISPKTKSIAYLSQWRRLHRHVGSLLEPLVKLKFATEEWKRDVPDSDGLHRPKISGLLEPVQNELAELSVFVSTCLPDVRDDPMVSHAAGWLHCASATTLCLCDPEPLDKSIRPAVFDALERLYAWAFEAARRISVALRDLDDLSERSCNSVENTRCPLRTPNQLPTL